MRIPKPAAAITLVLFVTACSKLEARRDTPQATVATLVKATQADRPDIVDAVVDRVLVRADARGAACLEEGLKAIQCTAAMANCFRDGHLIPYCKMPEGCSVSVTACTCGPKGNADAAKAPAFSASDSYTGLKSLKPTADSCTISGVYKISEKSERDAALPGFEENYCGELRETDELASVAMKCGENELRLVLRKGAGGWNVVGLAPATQRLLGGRGAEVRGVANQKKREADLNADLK